MNNTLFVFILFFPSTVFTQSDAWTIKTSGEVITIDSNIGGAQSFVISGMNNKPVKETGFTISMGEPSFLNGISSTGEGFYIGETEISGQPFKTAMPMPQTGGKWVYVPDGVELHIKREKEYQVQTVPVTIRRLK